MVPEQERSVNEFTTASTLSSTASSKTDEYDHFSRISNQGSNYSAPTPEVETEERFEKSLKSRHRDACRKMNSGNHQKAIKSFEGILADLLSRYGESHQRIGSALHNVAVANLRANELSGARDAIEEAVRIRKAALGEHHSKVGDSLVENGIILLSMKENELALHVFQAALYVREDEVAIAKNSQDTACRRDAQLKLAKVLHNLGCVNFELGRMDEARESYSKALEQQKEVFGTWASFMQRKSDSSRPGFLTMASTLCNQAYIELEGGHYDKSLNLLFESLDIQRELLEADNKLILTTMQNIGFAYTMQSNFDHAREIYQALVTLLQESYGSHAQKYWTPSIKSLVYCHIRLLDYRHAFNNLQTFEEFLNGKGGDLKNQDLQTTYELMGELNYHLQKIPSISEYTQRIVGQSCGNTIDQWSGGACECAVDSKEAVDAEVWFPKKPANGSKMSGHRLGYP